MKKLRLFSGNSHKNARLLDAAKHGDEASLQHLLRRSYESKKHALTSHILQEALSNAIDAHSVNCTRLLLEAGANPNTLKSSRCPVPISVYAIQKRLLDILQTLIENGCNVNQKWINNDTALHVAVRERCKEAVVVLLRAGADPCASNDHEESALTLTAANDAITILELFIAHPKAKDHRDIRGRTLLHIAVRNGQSKVLKHLLDSDFSADVEAYDGRTPLMDAIARDDLALVKLLLSKCQVDYVGGRGMTALLIAAQINNESCMRTLLEAGANINQQDDMGYTALIHAGPVESLVELLLEKGTNCNIQNHFGMTALWFAAFYHYPAIVNLLLRANSDPGLKGVVENEFHTTPLEIALKRGHYDISRRIIYCGCDNRNLAQFMANSSIMRVFRNHEDGQSLKVWITEWLSEVKSLKYRSRLCIRRSLGCNGVIQKVLKLPLPKILLRYVDLSELNSTSLFRFSPKLV